VQLMWVGPAAGVVVKESGGVLVVMLDFGIGNARLGTCDWLCAFCAAQIDDICDLHGHLNDLHHRRTSDLAALITLAASNDGKWVRPCGGGCWSVFLS
jgi:hypothetical protein